MSRADGRVFRALTMGGKAGLIMLLGKERKSMARSGELAVSIGKAQRRENGLSTAHTEAEARLLSEFRSRRAVLPPPYWVRASAASSWSSIGLSMNVRLIATVSRNVASVFAVTSYGVSGMTRWLHSRPYHSVPLPASHNWPVITNSVLSPNCGWDRPPNVVP